MSELHGEGLGEVLEQVGAEKEKEPCLNLTSDEVQRIIGDMDSFHFSRFAEAKGINFESPIQLEIDGEKVDQKFVTPEEVRAYLTNRFVNEA